MDSWRQLRRVVEKGRAKYSHIPRFARRGGMKKYVPNAKTFRNIYYDGPDRNIGSVASEAIAKAHYHLFRDHYSLILDPDLEKVRDEYLKLFLRGDTDYIDKIERDLLKEKDYLERLLAHKAISDDERKKLASIYWLLLRVYGDRVRIASRDYPYRRAEIDRSWTEGKNSYARAIELYGALDGVGLVVGYALRMSGLALDVNRIPIQERETNPRAIRDIFGKSQHHEYALALVRDEQFQWQAKRNMMVEAQYMEDEEAYVKAFESLVETHDSFAELGYNPGLVLPINQDVDTKRYLDLLYERGYKDKRDYKD